MSTSAQRHIDNTHRIELMYSRYSHNTHRTSHTQQMMVSIDPNGAQRMHNGYLIFDTV